MDSNFSRRRFLETSAAVLGVSLLGCGAEAPEDGAAGGAAGGAAKTSSGNAAKANPDGTLTLTGVGAVAKGAALPFTFPNGEPGLYYVTQSGIKGAVSAKCTHAGCVVGWQDDAAVPLHCPCHNSNFALDGKVLSGPAKAPLAHYAVAQKGDDAVLTKV